MKVGDLRCSKRFQWGRSSLASFAARSPCEISIVIGIDSPISFPFHFADCYSLKGRIPDYHGRSHNCRSVEQ
jgi:hypothetical protein